MLGGGIHKVAIEAHTEQMEGAEEGVVRRREEQWVWAT